MRFYIYDTDTMEIVRIFEGETNQECEKQAENANYMNCDEYGGTYNSFGLVKHEREIKCQI